MLSVLSIHFILHLYFHEPYSTLNGDVSWYPWKLYFSDYCYDKIKKNWNPTINNEVTERKWRSSIVGKVRYFYYMKV